MKSVLIIVSVLAALLVEWIAGITILGVSLPLVPFVVFFWYWNLSFSGRFWLGFSAGFFLDSISLAPFGTHGTIFFLGAFLVELLRQLFASSRFLETRFLGTGILLAFFLLLMPLFSAGLSTLQGIKHSLFDEYSLKFFSGAVIWAIILPVLSIFLGRLLGKR